MIVTDAIAGLTPAPVWEHFARIANIPRPSKREARIAGHIMEVARGSGLEVSTDATGNVLVRKPASAGRESVPAVALQSHLDMVCEKNRDVEHDFEREGIKLIRSDGYIRAKGTTLGADNGVGVAAALALMLDNTLVHGPLELLFTVDEETGLTGANGLQPGFLRSRTLLNLDSEEEGVLYVGCAGGRDTLLTLPITYEPVPQGFVPIGLTVSGLHGGHSGMDINTGRANAIKLLAESLLMISRSNDIRVAHMEGGSKRNAIPREAEAALYIKGERLKALRESVDEIQQKFAAQYGSAEPAMRLDIARSKPRESTGVLSNIDQDAALNLLDSLPQGVVAMSADIPGLVETSTNVATLSCSGDTLTIGTSQRSSVDEALNALSSRVAAAGKLAGARVEHTDGYPGWTPNLHSAVLQVARRSYHELFGKQPEIKAIHAGLECGIIGRKYPDMDMVSFGPTIQGAHSPDERVEILSVQRFWDFLLVLLEKLA
jgi:dipeptidase D